MADKAMMDLRAAMQMMALAAGVARPHRGLIADYDEGSVSMDEFPPIDAGQMLENVDPAVIESAMRPLVAALGRFIDDIAVAPPPAP